VIDTCSCNQQPAALSHTDSDSDSDDDDIYSDVYEILSSTNSKVMLMPDNQLTASDTHIKASSSPGPVERKPHTTMASSRSRMSIVRVANNASTPQPSVVSSRRRPTVKKFCIDDFNFVKVLGKGSFGKVRV